MWLMNDYDRCVLNIRNRERLFEQMQREKQLKRQQAIQSDRVLDDRVSLFNSVDDDVELKVLNVESSYVK